MKKLLIGIVMPALVAAPLIASAQTSTPSKSYDKDKASATKDTRAAFKLDANQLETSQLVGTRVKSEAGKDIGEIDNLLIDPQSGKVSHVVIGYGGLVGVGEKKVVVPWSDVKLTAQPDGKKPQAMMDQAKLDSAPRWERAARTDQPAASPSMRSPARDTDKDGKRDSADKAPSDPTRK
jgi:sporulation protein YlmC with PRC-barrel domain